MYQICKLKTPMLINPHQNFMGKCDQRSFLLGLSMRNTNCFGPQNKWKLLPLSVFGRILICKKNEKNDQIFCGIQKLLLLMMMMMMMMMMKNWKIMLSSHSSSSNSWVFCILNNKSINYSLRYLSICGFLISIFLCIIKSNRSESRLKPKDICIFSYPFLRYL